MSQNGNGSKSDKIWDTIFNAVGLLLAFAGFIAILFVGVFLAASSVYMFFKSMSFEGAKIAAGIFFSIFMLGVSATLAYCAIFTLKAVANKYIPAPNIADDAEETKQDDKQV